MLINWKCGKYHYLQKHIHAVEHDTVLSSLSSGRVQGLEELPKPPPPSKHAPGAFYRQEEQMYWSVPLFHSDAKSKRKL